jgi:signal transduction histidine kinase
MRLTFRVKLLSIVGVAAIAFLLLIGANALIAKRVDRQLAAIQGHYLPKVELQPQLEGQLERMQRAFQDAVAAHELDALSAPDEMRSTFLDHLAAAGDAVDASDALELRRAVDAYFDAASDVSRRLIAGETGEAIVDAIAVMQAKRVRTADLIKRAAALDRDDMSAAFAGARQAEAAARSYEAWICVACLVAVLLLSLALSRGLVRSVTELTDGFVRFGKGEFAETIPVASRDELGDLARHANEMAASLERSTAERKRSESALELSNRELEAFSYSVAHDLRAPLRAINGFSRALIDDYGDKLDTDAHDFLARIGAASERMGQLIDALLALSRVTRSELRRETVNLSRVAETIIQQLRAGNADREVDFVCQEGVIAYGDVPLLRAVLENLFGNAWKFTNGRLGARIAFGRETRDGESVYSVEDNGAGFDMAYAEKLFAPFQRLHSQAEFAGTGIGLATVQRIVHRHGGLIWAEGAVGKGATFHFTLANASQGADS